MHIHSSFKNYIGGKGELNHMAHSSTNTVVVNTIV